MPHSAFNEVAVRARAAATDLALATRAAKDAALEAMAEALLEDREPILAANAADVEAALAAGTPEHLVDRLRLDRTRLDAMAQGLRDVAALPDPVGEVLRGSTLANGLQLRQLRVQVGHRSPGRRPRSDRPQAQAGVPEQQAQQLAARVAAGARDCCPPTHATTIHDPA